MKKNALLVVLMVVILGLGAYFIMKGISKPEPQDPSNNAAGNSQNDTLVAGHQIDTPQLSNVNNPAQAQKAAGLVQSANSSITAWRNYTSSRLGFSFQYPGTWFKDGEDANVTNLKGAVTEVDVQFRDSSSKTSLLISYHLAPGGAGLYNYALSQYKSSQGWYAAGAKEVEVAGNKAIVATNTTKTDGRGRALPVPLKTILVDVLDKQQTGEIQFQFQTPVSGAEAQEAMFNQLLSGFRFTK